MTTPAKRKFVYQPHDAAVIKRAKEAEHLDRWRIQQGMDDPKLDRKEEISSTPSVGVRLAKQKQKQQRPQKLARQKAARQKLKAQAEENLEHDRDRYQARLEQPWPIVKRKLVGK